MSIKLCSFATELICLFLCSLAVRAFSDDEYVPPAFDKDYEGTVPFRNELRKHGIPTKLLHNERISPESMMKAFYDGPYSYINRLPNDRRTRDNFTKALTRYIAAHRSDHYKTSFRRFKDKFLTTRRSRISHEKKLTTTCNVNNGKDLVKTLIHPIATFQLGATNESRQALDAIIEKDLNDAGIDVTLYTPEMLAFIMQKLNYFDKFDPDELKLVSRRLSMFLRNKMSDNFEFLWKKKLLLLKKYQRYPYKKGTSTDFQIQAGSVVANLVDEAGNPATQDDNSSHCLNGDIYHSNSISEHMLSHNQLEQLHLNGDAQVYDLSDWQSTQIDEEIFLHPIISPDDDPTPQVYKYRESSHWEPELSDFGDSSSTSLNDYSFDTFTSSPNGLLEPLCHAAPASPGYEAYEDLRKMWYKD